MKEKILDLLKKDILRKNDKTIALHEPAFIGNESKYTKDCIDTGWVSSVGQYVTNFELKLAEYTKHPYSVVTTNGTSALHIALLAAGVQCGDEVLIPSFTFVAAANAVTYCGATCHFVDSDHKSLAVDPIKLEEYLAENTYKKEQSLFNKKTNKVIRALLVVHIFGHPADLDALNTVCEKYSIELIEDASESLGSFYKEKHTGHWSRFSVLSFNGNKIVTTGGGGAVLLKDESIAKKIKHLTTTAKVPHAWEFNHDAVGYNYRMPNINAALGCAQLENLPLFVDVKRNLAKYYLDLFKNIDEFKVFKEPSYARSNYWLNCILLEPKYVHLKNDVIGFLHKNQILVRPAWTLMHKLPMYSKNPRMNLSNAEDLESRIINLPSGYGIGLKVK